MPVAQKDQEPDKSALPLSRFKVLDLTHARAGPAGVRVLADWGADVLRIEQPPSDTELDEVVGKRESSDYQNLHRNKRSMTINLKSDEGRAIFMRLAGDADVVVENMRPAVKYRLGVDYEAVSKVNPRIVYGSLSGFGQYGPYADRPALDQIAQGMSGLMSVTGQPGSGPGRIGVAVTDLVSGAFLAQALLIALLEREATGKGRWVQTSLLETGIALLDFQATRWLINSQVPGQEGNFHPTVTPTGLYTTKDGFLNLSASGNRIFGRFCTAIGREDLPLDPRFSGSAERAKNRLELSRIVADVLSQRSTDEWISHLVSAGVPCGPVYNVQQVFEDPQVKELAMSQPIDHPNLGTVNVVAQPIEFSGLDRSIRTPTAALGEHTDRVLETLGFAPADVKRLHEDRVV
ncbi:CoA transferase [Corticibacterium sp. UT-5YL-CI-8]|nr:CoA transferase [Tianweitania sp. UT-5YL-CI-8]